jgi:hypothetical protein
MKGIEKHSRMEEDEPAGNNTRHSPSELFQLAE